MAGCKAFKMSKNACCRGCAPGHANKLVKSSHYANFIVIANETAGVLHGNCILYAMILLGC